MSQPDEIKNNLSGTAKDSPQYLLPFLLIISLFFMWGVANNLNDILIKQFKKSFVLSDFQSGLVQSVFYMGYFLLAVPAAALMKKYGYKAGIILGLLLYATGAFLFYPAAEVREYAFFLLALFVIASGLAFLETAANPYVTVLGPPQTSERRLNFAQSFNPLGAVTGVLAGRFFIFSGKEYTTDQLAALSPQEAAAYFTAETKSVQIPYLIIGSVVVLWAVLIYFTKFPEIKEPEDKVSHNSKGLKNLLKHRHFKRGVLAQFLYVGAQVGVWSFLIRYSQYVLPGTSEFEAADYLTIALVLFIIGRFAGTALMRLLQANKIMALFAVLNVLLTATAVFIGGKTGIWALLLTSMFMSIMFPTIFALSIKGLGSDTKLGSSIVIMAIVGGAILTALMGLVSDLSNIRVAFLIPMLAFAYVGWYALKGSFPEIEKSS